MNRIRTGLFLLLSALVLLPAEAGAQDARLDAAELAADAGDIERAREYLAGWFASDAAVARNADVARALVLRARLAESAEAAEVDYLEAAVNGGDRYGALARLRLAQLRLTRGRPALALADLERLRVDFPGSELVPESWLWSGIAREATGDLDTACDDWHRADVAQAPDSVRAQAREALSRCGVDPGEVGGPPVYTVQLGAFGTRSAASEVRDRAAAAGVEARIREPDESTPLYRVRVGSFAQKDYAARVAVQLRSTGLEAIVVTEGP